MKNLLLILALCCAIQTLIAQPAIKSLYFNSADNITRLNFATDPPTVSLTGLFDAEGIAAGIVHYEDLNGNLMFRINSNAVYNRNGALMPGSVNILTNPSATEISVCAKPNDNSKYYIFYNSELCSPLRYSIIDMNLNGGLGDVTNLNTIVDSTNFGEGIEIIRIPGTCEYWLIGYECNNGFKRFRIDENGITPGTIIEPYIPPFSYDGRGELDFHRNKIGCAFTFSNTVFVSDFDAVNGTIANAIIINNPVFNNAPYGLEFSPDASKMYFSLWYSGFLAKDIYQYDFATQTYTGYDSPGSSNIGQIEMGGDGKLYIINEMTPVITVITNPNDSIPIFSIINTTDNLGLGISDFIQSDLFNTDVFRGDTTCRTVGNSVVLTTNNPNLTYNWINAITGEIMFTGNQYSFIMPTNPVNLFVVNNDAPACSDTLHYLINPNPDINAGPDLTIQLGESVQIQSSAEISSNFVWFPDTGLDNPFVLSPNASPSSTTTYLVAATVGECQSNDAMTITVIPYADGINQPISNNATNPIFTLSPNPANNQVTLSFTTPINTNTKIVLTDLNGKTITVYNNPANSPNVTIYRRNLPKGLYFVQVQDANSNQVLGLSKVVFN